MGTTKIASNGNVSLRKRVNSTGSISLFLDIHQNGKRLKEYLGADYKLTGNRDKDKEVIRLAKVVMDKRATVLRENIYGIDTLKKSKVDFCEFVQTYLDDKPKAWQNTYKHLLAFCKNKPLPISSITIAWIEKWKDYLCKQLKPTSARTYNAVTITALNMAVRQGLISNNPYNTLKNKGISAPQPKREYLTMEEVYTLSKTPYVHDNIKRAFLFACFCGLRLCDVKRLTWENIKPEGISVKQEKTGEVVYLQLSETARRFLPIVEEQSGSVFNLSHNDEHTRKHLKRWVISAGIAKNISFHNSRHSFATNLLEEGEEIYSVMELLGHKSIKHTLIYSHMSTSKKQKVVSALDSKFNNLEGVAV